LVLLLLLLALIMDERRLCTLLLGSLPYAASLPAANGAVAYDVLACMAAVGPVRNMERTSCRPDTDLESAVVLA
jgi:hypothetical protein